MSTTGCRLVIRIVFVLTSPIFITDSMVKQDELKGYGAMSSNRPSIQERYRPSVFDFKSGGTCPTCQGTGKIPRGMCDFTVLCKSTSQDIIPTSTCISIVRVPSCHIVHVGSYYTD